MHFHSISSVHKSIENIGVPTNPQNLQYITFFWPMHFLSISSVHKSIENIGVPTNPHFFFETNVSGLQCTVYNFFFGLTPPIRR
ncbi:hypothetical protein SORBI_3002G223050 [Sorghum bicolor]|uniref:Uncharacterized protein n=1 Tax=Sorghum bicolor TaxID=4558 RepID=A0A1W0W5B7_SORBI|nr:hypothetical protein SORBI_3002G223050 [Sorghum bicolor]